MRDRMTSTRSRLAKPIAVLLALMIVATGVIAAGVPAVGAATATSTPGVLTTSPVTTNCPTPGSSTTVKAASTYAIVSNDSTALYQAHEDLAGVGANTAVGKTNAIIGNIYFNSAGVPRTCSRFDVDLRTLKSDQARRDNFLYNNTLETGQYPLATFILTSVQGLEKPLSSNETTFTLVGDLTIHGVTKLVTWQATAKLDGDTLTGNAFTTFEMPDFNITPPKVGPVLGLSQTVRLEVTVSAKKAA